MGFHVRGYVHVQQQELHDCVHDLFHEHDDD